MGEKPADSVVPKNGRLFDPEVADQASPARMYAFNELLRESCQRPSEREDKWEWCFEAHQSLYERLDEVRSVGREEKGPVHREMVSMEHKGMRSGVAPERDVEDRSRPVLSARVI